MRLSSFRLSLIALALAVAPAGAEAQTQRVAPESKAQIQLSFAPIVRQTAGAVVNVYASRSERRKNAAM